LTCNPKNCIILQEIRRQIHSYCLLFDRVPFSMLIEVVSLV
jgi:hypothetical protein